MAKNKSKASAENGGSRSQQRRVRNPRGFLTDFEKKKLRKMLDVCGQDTDAASLAVLGDDLAHCRGCVLVLKGQQETKWLHSLLVGQQLITEGKGIAKDF